ncbi:unnamed protein product [Penicillium salamii]|uniref:Uncharacterized protein n=1 Tax=Penicillium salamii TaxID=1612424 RepID=A0A9W4JE99_9EURO|nr:unnamed protein product [Penicillium salamii]CAG8227577.1 unnamed protein product [Penicillium salamii]CAG8374759.1 unnamed protein product [Penicillium salamii]CAG8383589.1 unnamed protein product [Penicillium salamii]CAG8386997.1 unnamed protein product [Penicillium salamii]
MASLATRQGYHLGPSIPRPPKEAPSTPIKTDRSIDPKVFFELFAGTIGIFVLAVLFWKLGRFVRRFNRNKVLEAGRPINARYARTWYGWVPWPTHERNKKVVRDFIASIWDSLAWKSTRDDYSWVWWDPGDIERQKRQRNKSRLWWLPNCFKSYEDSPTADDIWNPCGRSQCDGALRQDIAVSVVSSPTTTRMPVSPDILASNSPQQHMATESKPLITRSIMEELYRDPMQASDDSSHHHPHFHSPNRTRLATRIPFTHPQVQSLPSHQRHSYHARGSIPWSCGGMARDISCHIDSVVDHRDYQSAYLEPNSSVDRTNSKPSAQKGHKYRYRAWSARMQLGPGPASLHHGGGSSGPPGTPMTELLASYPSNQSSSSPCHSKQVSGNQRANLQVSEDRISSTSRMFIDNRLLFANEGRTYTRTFQWNSAPARSQPQGRKKMPAPRPKFADEWLLLCDKKGIPSQNHFSVSRDKGIFLEPEASIAPTDRIQLKTGGAVNNLSDWEVMLLERLDRKLVWVFNEFTPGQKPYHFATLANHWLNKETWIVYDPISRVPTNARRQWGDPRFNVPYPEPVLGPRPKYPAVTRKRANNPRIDSWRAMANKQRKVSGIREAIRTLTLYEDSADEPPDGHIDPASWALPKPPQGFQMSTAQRNAWYEGGAGWQEKLHDWQQVHRGYRVHKALHEGRVNRTKLKEVISHISKPWRPAAGKPISDFDVSSQRRASHSLVS